MYDVLLDNLSMLSMGVYTAERPAIPTSELELETINVDGRDGDLTRQKGFKDISHTIRFNVLEESNIKPLMRQVKAKFMNATTLQINDDDVYYKIKKVVIGNIANEVDIYGDFTVTFLFDPFQYQLNVQNIIVTNSMTITNPGTRFSLPRLRVDGNGAGQITINNEVINLIQINSYLYIDSEIGNAHIGEASMNRYMEGDFPILAEGNNVITFTGGITRIEIEPRWRYI